MAMFPALMNDTTFSDLFDDPFFEGWRNMDRAAACDPQRRGVVHAHEDFGDGGVDAPQHAAAQGHRNADNQVFRRAFERFFRHCGSFPFTVRSSHTVHACSGSRSQTVRGRAEEVENLVHIRSDHRVRHGEDLVQRLAVPYFFD